MEDIKIFINEKSDVIEIALKEKIYMEFIIDTVSKEIDESNKWIEGSIGSK